jgi:signal transduction histidine kinase
VTESVQSAVERPRLSAESPAVRASRHPARDQFAWWELTVSAAALAAAAATFSLTVNAHFLAHPGWLAVQKADVILGPTAVGLYWRRRRPASRFGPLLIVFGFVGAVYILQSSRRSALFTAGVAWELVIYAATLALILGFPSGRLRGLPERAILAVGAVVVPGIFLAFMLLAPQISGDGSISGCRAACPANALLVSPQPQAAQRLLNADRVAIIALAVATAVLLVWRFATGTRPQRRALAIGGPIALLFLLTQAVFQATNWLAVNQDLNTFIRWTIVGTRAALWYGFLLALVVAELFAGRVLRRILEHSLQRPSLGELEAMLKSPLGDPSLRLAFWQPRTATWADAEGEAVEPPPAGSADILTVVERKEQPAAAIVHDIQLADDPELLQAAGAATLLAYENAELEAAWNEALRELRQTHARLAAAGVTERRKLERDLHDGPQQRLLALLLSLATTRQLTADDSALRRELTELEGVLEDAIDELRELAHGIYPSVLADWGIARALRSAAMQAPRTVEVTGELRRHPPEIESAVYYCCLEGLQNAMKHAGTSAKIWIRLDESDEEIRFEVRDDGTGFDARRNANGRGIGNIRDRLAAIGGRLEIRSQPGQGTALSGLVPAKPTTSLPGRPAVSGPSQLT